IGHPTHAFDADMVGKTMVVRASKKGEKLTTLDGKTHSLPGGDIVIDNGTGELIDLVGIMGTANSVVQESTTRVLFFIDHSDPARIRKTSMSLAIRTNAAQLNEKMIDPNLAMEALLRGIALFQEVAGATVESPILDLYPNPTQPTTIVLSEKLVKTYLGLELPVKTQQDILEKLGCTVKRQEDSLSVTVPTLRPDLEIPVDLVEEIARIYGYHNLPSQLMDTRLPTSYPEDTDFSLEHTVKQFLADLGWQEVYTYSAVSTAVAEKSGKSLDSHLKLLNPLNDDHVYLRQSLVPSHKEVIEKNKHLESISIFEIANVYTPRENDLPEESLRLTLTSTWPYREVKGHVEALLTKLFIQKRDIEFAQKGNRHAEIQVRGTQIGSIVHEENGHTTAGFLWKSLLHASQKHPTYTPTSQYSPIIEDMTFTIPDKVKVGDVIKTLMATDSLIQDVVMKDLYHRNATFTIQYASNAKQLSTQDVEPIRKMIVEKLADSFRTAFVGKGV
ncbi:MAG TPA: phenylalanine--tRNA ligase subunit beta, partial [Patescibacteria group bacterium]|nr:phenylalanine--tRNA ligase subunit beta [Patescibacteria group bacterium]